MFIIYFLFLVSPFYFNFFIFYGLTHHPPPAEKSCRNNGAFQISKLFRSGKLWICFGSYRQLFQKQGLLMVKTNEIC